MIRTPSRILALGVVVAQLWMTGACGSPPRNAAVSKLGVGMDASAVERHLGRPDVVAAVPTRTAGPKWNVVIGDAEGVRVCWVYYMADSQNVFILFDPDMRVKEVKRADFWPVYGH